MHSKKNSVENANPPSDGKILLHSCCAPCSAAIIENLYKAKLNFSVYYFNPNIFPQEEYELRKNENKRYADSLGIEFIDADWSHNVWLEACEAMSDEPERGCRCLECFKLRLLHTASYAKHNGFNVFTTTLSSSRWKSIEQIFTAGKYAESQTDGVKFWARNWRKGGLSERRAQLLRECAFYNQQYCGCEFSVRTNSIPTR